MIKQILLLASLFFITTRASYAATFKINEIEVNDFRESTQYSKSSRVYTLEENENYRMVFNSFDSVFTIFVFQEDYKTHVDTATKSLLETHLKIDKKQACWLKINILGMGALRDKYPITEPQFCITHVSRRQRDKKTDMNNDGKTNSIDYALILQKYNAQADIKEDVNGDGIVNALDLSLVTTNLNTSTP